MLTRKLLGLGLIASLYSISASAELPIAGTEMEAVASEYGEPTDKTLPIGQPPITRWIYDTFTVVFEENRVIHAFPRKTSVENRPLNEIPQRPGFVNLIDQSINKPGAEVKPVDLIQRNVNEEQLQEEMEMADQAAQTIDAPETPVTE